MNNKCTKNSIIILLVIIGVGKYLPLYHFPEFLNNLYFNYGLIIMIMSFLLTGLCLLIWKTGVYVKLFSVIMFVSVFGFSHKIHDMNNKLIIEYNINSDILRNPILGVKLDTLNPKQGKGVFLFNCEFGLYDALVYSPNHHLVMNSWEIMNEECYHKIYNVDWWWYKHID